MGEISRPRKTLPGWTRRRRSVPVEIDNVKGALPVGDMNMPYLRKLYLYFNKELKGEAGRG